MEVASLGEPACVGIYGVFQSGVQPGDDVLVAGLNFQGQIAVEGLKAKGTSQVIAVDYREPRLKMAKEPGADVVLDMKTDDVASRIEGLTQYNADQDAGNHQSGDAGVDVSFHFCGYWNPNQEAYFNLCVENTRDEGIVASIPSLIEPVTVDLHRIHHHGMEIRMPALIHHGSELLDRWVPRLMKPIVKGVIDVESLITTECSLSEVDEAMKRYDEDESQVKIALSPQ